MEFTHLNKHQLSDLRLVFRGIIKCLKNGFENRIYKSENDIYDALNTFLLLKIKRYNDCVEAYNQYESNDHYQEINYASIDLIVHSKFILYALNEQTLSFLVNTPLKDCAKKLRELFAFSKQNKINLPCFDYKKKKISPVFRDVEFIEKKSPYYA